MNALTPFLPKRTTARESKIDENPSYNFSAIFRAECTNLLKEIGDPVKIMACLDADHEKMMKVETCAKKKLNGELGCTNSATPVNLTIPLIPVIEIPSLVEAGAVPVGEQVSTPSEPPLQLRQYLMCIDECTHDDMDVIPGRKKRSPATCAFKLKCALAPPSDATQNAYTECQKEVSLTTDNHLFCLGKLRNSDFLACLRSCARSCRIVQLLESRWSQYDLRQLIPLSLIRFHAYICTFM